jgi:hypothetical protein
MSSSNLDAIRRRLAAATSTDWQRLQHYNEAQEEFHAHAAADMATLLAALDAAEARAAIVQRVAERALARDTVIPLGAAGRDKAFRLLEEFCGDMQYLAGRVAYVAPAQEVNQ